MNGRTIIFGVAATAMLLAIMVATRLMSMQPPITDTQLREVETIRLDEPPPPPPPPPEPNEPPPPPPPPALQSLPVTSDPSRIPLPEAKVPFDPRLAVDTFSLDVEPAALPQPEVAKPAPRRVETPKPRQPAPAKPRPAPPARSVYSTSELDGQPRLIRHPRVSFPQALVREGVTSGTVVVEVELSTNGSVTFRRVIRASHPGLVEKARQVASGSRFTPPMKDGRPVKAVMRWPITIKR